MIRKLAKKTRSSASKRVRSVVDFARFIWSKVGRAVVGVRSVDRRP